MVEKNNCCVQQHSFPIVTKVDRRMKDKLEEIRRSMEEHLSAINDNTCEIQILFDYLQEIEKKVDKYSVRLDQLQLGLGKPLDKISILPLNHLEKKIFLILYTEEAALTTEEIAEKAGISVGLVPEYITSLAQKNVPLQRNFCNQQFFFSLERQFKELQAKENLVNLSLQSFM